MNYQFKIQIKGITKPPVWRRIIVSEDITFAELHEIIQCVFGWGNYHLYQFKDKEWGGEVRIAEPSDMDDMYFVDTLDANKLLLKHYFQRGAITKIFYEYDFGDSWIHTITLESAEESTTNIPMCLDGKGACPPEDCGGIYGYAHLKETFENTPTGKEAKNFREWLGLGNKETWDAKKFDLDETNKFLSTYHDEFI